MNEKILKLIDDYNIKQIFNFIMIVLIILPLIKTAVVFDGWKMVLYLIGYIYLPGRFIEKRIIGLKKQKKFDFLMSFFLGFAFIVIQYYLFNLTKTIHVIKYFSLIISLTEVAISFNSNKNSKDKIVAVFNNIKTMEIILLFITFYMYYFATNFRMFNQEQIGYQDFTWQIGNVTGLASSLPYMTMTVYGGIFKYHYFNALFFAIGKIIFGGESWLYFGQFTSFFLPELYFFSVMLLLDIINTKFILKFSVYILLIFSLFAHDQWFTIHVFSNVNAVGLAIPILILIVLMSIEIFNQNTSLKYIFSYLGLILLLEGIKGPFGLMIIFLQFVLTLLNKDRIKINILIFISSVVCFLILYFCLLNSGGSSYYSEYQILGDVTLGPLLDWYNGINISFLKLIIKIMFIIPTLLKRFNIFLFFFIFNLIRVIFDLIKRKFDIHDVIGVLGFAGIFAWIIVRIPGSSNGYFLFAGYPFLAYMILYDYSIILDKKVIQLMKTSLFFVFLNGFFILFFIVGILFSIYCCEKSGFFAKPIDLKKYITKEYDTKDRIFDAYNYIYNTNNDSIVATNKLSQDGTNDKRCHSLSAYGERHVYLEGYEYAVKNSKVDVSKNLYNNNMLFDDNISIKLKKKLIDDLGINYLFIYKNYGNNIDSYRYFGDVVFDNSRAIIIKCRKSD